MDIAVRIEKNGVAFYDALVGSTSDGRAREVYKFMAGEERQHIIDFTGLGERVEAFLPVETYAGEHEEYLEALAETHMFVEDGVGAELAKRAANDKEAIAVAAQFEKDSILLFDLLKDLVPEKEKGTIEALIGQEKRHLTKLHGLARSLGVG
jgi:rubrerythrin